MYIAVSVGKGDGYVFGVPRLLDGGTECSWSSACRRLLRLAKSAMLYYKSLLRCRWNSLLEERGCPWTGRVVDRSLPWIVNALPGLALA